jgi:F-type H+-transporting ATPase subunit gamma
MPTLKDIKRRIGSVKNTQKITRAMKLVSAAKLRRAQEAITAARPYAIKIREVVSVLAAAVDHDSHELLRDAEATDKSLILVITSDRGLCGPFNGGLLRTVEAFVSERKDEFGEMSIEVVGRKGVAYFGSRRYTVDGNHPELNLKGVNFASATKLVEDISARFVAGDYGRVFVAYNEFRSAIQINQRIEQVLPVPVAVIDQEGEDAIGDFIFEPDRDLLLSTLLPKYVETQIFRAMLDSVASEHGSRMTAMDNATNNASDMIGKLTLQYNRARQAAITKELVEITSGAQAISN